MPNAVPIGGTRYLQSLTGYFTDSVTILRSTKTKDDYNSDVDTWAPLAGHSEIPAAIGGGDVGIRLKKQEFLTSQVTYEMQYRRIFLAGSFSEIQHTDRARFEDDDWAIISIVTDQTKTMTELYVESIEPGAI
jgi:hypothetical protein